MRVLLCYDIVASRRRAKLHDRLCGYLRPVQYSVFEGELPERRWDELLTMVKRHLDPKKDTVRIYQLCRGCKGTVVLLGTSPAIGDGKDPIVV